MTNRKAVKESTTRQHWSVYEPTIVETGYKGFKEPVLVGFSKNGPLRFYPLFDTDIQIKLLGDLMLVIDRKSALSFTAEWGLLVKDASAMALRSMLDAAASVKWIYELLEQLKQKEPQDYWITVTGDSIVFDRDYAPKLCSSGLAIPTPFGAFYAGVLTSFSTKGVGSVATGVYKNWPLEDVPKSHRSKTESIRTAANEIVCDWINDMLLAVNPALTYKDSVISQAVAIESPWAAIAYQLLMKASGATSGGVCRNPNCAKTFTRLRSTKLYCSGRCRKWCERNLPSN